MAKALAGSAFFVVFISPNAVNSQNVRNEINYALNNRKPFLAIHMVETELPPGLQLRMGDIQAIMKYRMIDESYGWKLAKTLPESLRSAEVLEEREMEVKRSEELFLALTRVAGNGEAWKCGLATIWRTDHTHLTVSSWSVEWDAVPPMLTRRFQQMAPPRVLDPATERDLRGYAGGFVTCNRLLQPNTPVSKLRIATTDKLHFDPPWHNWKHMGMGDVDFVCKQCGYDGFNLGHYDSDRTVPTECPRCALGRDMPEDTRKY